jgi:acyl-coenzyme A synthetase/AMP-(fatty) acid ligase
MNKEISGQLNSSAISNQMNSKKDLCIHELFEEQARILPKKIAIKCNDKQLTYSELSSQSSKIANYIIKNNIAPKRIIALSVERSIESIVILLGILKAGAAYVPLDPSYPIEIANLMIKDSKAIAVFTQAKFSKQFVAAKTSIFIIEDIIKIIESESDKLRPLERFTSEDLASVIFTSGTSGKPKGVCLAHKGLVNRLIWMSQYSQIQNDDRVLNKTSTCFDISIWEIFLPLISGALLLCAGAAIPRSSKELVELIQNEKITIIHFVPTMFKLFLDTEGSNECLSLRHIFISGDVLHLQMQQIFFSKLNCHLHNLYGPTEASIDVTHWECKEDSTLSFIPIGKPIANTKIYILNNHLKEAAVGKIGQIYIGGDCLATGYLNKKLTDKYFISHPVYGRLYKTGDFAKLMHGGNIEFIGRKDRQIKLGGYRVELNGIESIILSHKIVHSVAVTYIEVEAGYKQIVAYLVLNKKLQIKDSINRIIYFLKEKMPSYMIPNIFACIDNLPLSQNKKINYNALPNLNLMSKVKDGLYSYKTNN